MLISASSEFVELCQTQANLLAQNLGAASSIVYLTENLGQGTKLSLVPVVAYPPLQDPQVTLAGSALLPAAETEDRLEDRLTDSAAEGIAMTAPLSPALVSETLLSPLLGSGVPGSQGDGAEVTAEPEKISPDVSLSQRQMVLPLIYEGVVVGGLVTTRLDRPWTLEERNQVEQTARTLAIARVLDQRSQWFEQRLQQNQRFQAQQSDLLHNLLHQFRNPLTALRTFGKLMLKRLQSEDPNYKAAAGIVRESDRLKELLQQFDAVVELGDSSGGDFSQDASWVLPPGVEPPEVQSSAGALGETGGLQKALPATPPHPSLPSAGWGANLALTACKVTDILRPLLDSEMAIAQERQIQLQTELPAALPAVWADPKALTEVFSNLIDNALKYTAPGAQIYVQAGLRQDRHQGILVCDSGPGIPATDLDRIFERHYRGIQADTEIPGTGLGLAIAKDLVIAMEGEIQVFSPAATCRFSPTNLSLAPKANSGPGAAFIVWLLEA